MSKNVEDRSKNENTLQSGHETVGTVLADGLFSSLWRSGRLLGSVNIKYAGDGVLLMVKVSRSSEGKVICFVGGKDLVTACRKLQKGLREDSLNWREDRPYQGTID